MPVDAKFGAGNLRRRFFRRSFFPPALPVAGETGILKSRRYLFAVRFFYPADHRAQYSLHSSFYSPVYQQWLQNIGSPGRYTSFSPASPVTSWYDCGTKNFADNT